MIEDYPLLRPADICTSAAVPGRLAALNIGITAPNAGGSGDDSCAAVHDSKVAKYGPHEEALAGSGIVYAHMVFAALGRAHHLAHRAARRRGLLDYRPSLRYAKTAIGLEIARRAHSMVHAGFPKLRKEDEVMLFGIDPADAHGAGVGMSLVMREGPNGFCAWAHL